MVFFKNLHFSKDYADFAIRVQASDSRQFDVHVVFFVFFFFPSLVAILFVFIYAMQIGNYCSVAMQKPCEYQINLA